MTEIRRRDREMESKERMIEVLRENHVCRLAFFDGDYPYIIPMNYGMEEKDGHLTLYFHCALQGKKLELIAQNPHVAFEVDGNHQLMGEGDIPCTYGYGYTCVAGRGIATLLQTDEEKLQALKIIMQHQTGRTDFTWRGGEGKVVACFAIDVTEYSGKERKSN